jgi:hypothetical protein
MSKRDPWRDLAVARRRYAQAIAARDEARPGTVASTAAVRELGVRWWQLQRCERVVRDLGEPARRGSTSGPPTEA